VVSFSDTVGELPHNLLAGGAIKALAAAVLQRHPRFPAPISAFADIPLTVPTLGHELVPIFLCAELRRDELVERLHRNAPIPPNGDAPDLMRAHQGKEPSATDPKSRGCLDWGEQHLMGAQVG
jgi:hypothetical protein